MPVLGRIVEDNYVHGNIVGDNPMLSGGMEFSEVRKGREQYTHKLIIHLI